MGEYRINVPVRIPVVRRVPCGIVPEPAQHGGDGSHVALDVVGYGRHPLGQSLQVDGLYHLISRPLRSTVKQEVRTFTGDLYYTQSNIQNQNDHMMKEAVFVNVFCPVILTLTLSCDLYKPIRKPDLDIKLGHMT